MWSDGLGGRGHGAKKGTLGGSATHADTCHTGLHGGPTGGKWSFIRRPFLLLFTNKGSVSIHKKKEGRKNSNKDLLKSTYYSIFTNRSVDLLRLESLEQVRPPNPTVLRDVPWRILNAPSPGLRPARDTQPPCPRFVYVKRP